MITDPARLCGMIRLRGLWSGNHERNDMLQCEFSRDDKPMRIDLREVAIGDVSTLYCTSLLGVDQLVFMLLAAGEDVNSLGPEGTCLAAAAFCGHLSTVKLPLKRGSEVNAVVIQTSPKYKVCQYRTAIHCAVGGQHEAVARILLAEGADVNIRRSLWGGGRGLGYDTPLQTAVSIRNKGLVQLMIDAGAYSNAYAGRNEMALKLACKEQRIDIMKMLLEAGVDPNISTGKIRPYRHLSCAIPLGNLSGAEVLIKHGPDLKSVAPRACCGKMLYNEDGFVSAIEVLMHLLLNVSVGLPLIAGAKYSYAKAIDHMLRHGATPDFQDSDGIAAIHAASFTPLCDGEVVELLLNANANVNIHGGPFGSALQAAALSGKTRVVQILLENGALVNCADGGYGTALKIARDRLEDQKRDWPVAWKGDIDLYGPRCYLSYSYLSVPLGAEWLGKARAYPDHEIQLLAACGLPSYHRPSSASRRYSYVIESLN